MYSPPRNSVASHAPAHTILRRLAPLALGLSLLAALFLASPPLRAQSKVLQATQQYLNIPIGRQAKLRIFTINDAGGVQRTVPLQLADDTVDYWIYLDISEFKGKTITLSGPATQPALDRIYQAATIHDAATLYKEANRPQIHFTVKRGWSNDVNGPIFYNGQYHLFWQAFPFGVLWDTGFMYWGHATSKDLIHWTELSPALMLDRLGSPWSGSSLVDHHNAAGFGKDALVLVYTAFDRATKKQVQCLAYSTDNGVTFTRFEGNPILDTNDEVAAKIPATRTSSGTPPPSTGSWFSLRRMACPSSTPQTSNTGRARATSKASKSAPTSLSFPWTVTPITSSGSSMEALPPI